MTELRRLAVTDAPAYFNLVERSQDGLQIFPWIRDFDLEKAEDRITRRVSINKQNTITLYGIFKDDLLVGSVEVDHKNARLDGHELGYFMDDQHRNCGYMKEALTKVIELHKDESPYYADVLDDNAASLWLLWGLGFKEDYRWKKDANSATFVRLVYKRHLS